MRDSLGRGRYVMHTTMLVVLVTILGLDGGLVAQVSSPAEVARAVIDADARRDWQAILRLAHPSALNDFKRSQIEFVRMDSDTVLRRLEAEHGGRLRIGPSSFTRFMLDSVFRVHTLEGLEALPADSIMARFLRMPGMREPAADSAIVRSARVIPGYLTDGDSVAFVIIRRVEPHPPRLAGRVRSEWGGADDFTEVCRSVAINARWRCRVQWERRSLFRLHC